MQSLLYYLGWALAWVLQRLPLRWLARVGRFGGAVAWQLLPFRRQVAQDNVQLCFGAEQSPAESLAVARESVCRLGEALLCAIGTAAMDRDRLRRCVEVVGLEKLAGQEGVAPVSTVLTVGHFGNFELFTHMSKFLPGWQVVTSYRSLKPPFLDRLVLELRRSADCLLFERRSQAALLRAALQRGPTLLGLLADQSAGGKGLRLPFLGRGCSTTRAPALLALRYHMRLHTAVCYRVGLAQWRIEIGDEIATHHGGTRCSLGEIMLDVNRAFEAAVRRDPANWYWVHRRWKTAA